MSETHGILTPALNEKGQMLAAVVEENIPTGGHFQTESINIEMLETDTTIVKDISFPFPISLLSAAFYTPLNCDGDHAHFYIAPDVAIGLLRNGVSSGVTVFDVQQSVIDNTAIGFHMKLTDMANMNDLGRVLAVDEETLQITTENATTNAFAAETPSIMLQTVKIVPQKRLVGGQLVEVGSSKIGGSYVPADVKIRCIYENISGIARTFSLDIEYLY